MQRDWMGSAFWVGILVLFLSVQSQSIQPVWAQTSNASWQVSQEKLDNGLTVLLLEDHRSPVITLQVWYKVGARNEQLGRTGISHLLEHLMFRGTTKYGEGEFTRLVKEKGGSLNAFTSADHTVYFERVAAAYLDLMLDLESDRLANLVLDEKGLEAERQIVMEERRMRTSDNPASDLWEQLSAAAYTAHPYGWPVVGFQHDLEAITLDSVKKYRQIYYAPGNAILVIAGDVTPETLLPKIKATFGAIPAGPAVPPVTATEPPQRGERRLTFRRPASLPIYAAAYHVPNMHSDDSPALAVLATILSSGRSARFQKTLVEQKMLALAADASYDRTSKDAPLFSVSMRVAPQKKWHDAEAALYEEIERMKTQVVTHTELERAKNLVESRFIYGQDSLFYRAMQLGQYASLGDWKLVHQVVPSLQAVTAADVQRVAQTYLREENRTVGILIPEGPPIRERPDSSGHQTAH